MLIDCPSTVHRNYRVQIEELTIISRASCITVFKNTLAYVPFWHYKGQKKLVRNYRVRMHLESP